MARKNKRKVLIEKYQSILHKRRILFEKFLPRKTCLYFHVNPVEQEIFYVGIGNEKIPYAKGRRTKFWYNIINKYDYQVIVIESNLSWEEACEKEIYWIKRIGRRDLNEGTLVNHTDGGDGAKNPSKETRKKISKAQKGRESSLFINIVGKKFGKLTIIKRSENKGKQKNVTAWICECECGNKNFETLGNSLSAGKTTSCGCSYGGLNSSLSKPVLQLNKTTGNILSAFDSIKTATKLTNMTVSGIHDYVQGRDLYGGGYDWRVITKEEYLSYEIYHNISNFKYINGKIIKSVIAKLPNKQEIKFESLTEAQRKLGIDRHKISKLLKEGIKHKETGIIFK